jgi:hypothetical protein
LTFVRAASIREAMREDKTSEIVEEILSSRDVLTAITDDMPTGEAAHEQGEKLLSREDIKNECETVKVHAAKGVFSEFTFFPCNPFNARLPLGLIRTHAQQTIGCSGQQRLPSCNGSKSIQI